MDGVKERKVQLVHVQIGVLAIVREVSVDRVNILVETHITRSEIGILGERAAEVLNCIEERLHRVYIVLFHYTLKKRCQEM